LTPIRTFRDDPRSRDGPKRIVCVFYSQVNIHSNKGQNTTDYCVGYRCGEHGWKIGFSLCVCPEENVFRKKIDEFKSSDQVADSTKSSKDELCCNSTFYTASDSKNKKVFCPLNSTKGLSMFLQNKLNHQI
jgi:hypothetical protein